MTRIEKRLSYWQKRTGLSNWLITVEINNDPGWPNMAEIGPVPGRPEAVLTIASGPNPMEVEFVLVHELCHLIIWPLNTMTDAWASSLPAKSRNTYEQQWIEATEQLVDNLTRLFIKEPPRPIEKPKL